MSYQCRNVILNQRRQYSVLSGSTELSRCNPKKKKVLRTWQGSFKPVTEPTEPLIKKILSHPSLTSNADMKNDIIHEAVAIIEDLVSSMLKMQPSFYCQKQTIPNCSEFFSIIEEHLQHLQHLLGRDFKILVCLNLL